MPNLIRGCVFHGGLLVALFLFSGCGGSGETPRQVEADARPDAEPASSPSPAEDPQPEPAPGPDFAPVVLGGEAESADGAGEESDAAGRRRQEVLAAMMPLQVMLGDWRGITQRQVGDFKGVDEPHWVWDFQTDRSQPAMVMTSEGAAWFQEMRLTWLTDRDTFRMTSRGPDGQTRTFEGEFAEHPAEEQGDDNRPHVTYKLTLTQLESDETDDRLQVVFNQQENNRYLLEIYRRRGSAFRRIDTVSTQRQGTSIAASDEDYGERTCVISGGLGTIQVRHNGRTFWVCCTGCQAAFEDDPDTWIAEFDAANEGTGGN